MYTTTSASSCGTVRFVNNKKENESSLKSQTGPVLVVACIPQGNRVLKGKIFMVVMQILYPL
jgi:hypothetical protein